MSKVPRKHDPEFKRKVALEALKQEKTVIQLTSEYKVHASQIAKWKQIAYEGVLDVFNGGLRRVSDDRQGEIDELHRQLGVALAQGEWLKKKL
jgi:transposase